MVLDEADDLDVGLVRVGETLADRILPRPEAPRQGLVDHGNRRGAGPIRGAELPALDNAHADRGEIVWSHPVLKDVHVFARRGRVARNANRAGIASTLERHEVGEADARHAWQRR